MIVSGSIKDMVLYKQKGKSISALFAEGFKALSIGLLKNTTQRNRHFCWF